MFEISPSAT